MTRFPDAERRNRVIGFSVPRLEDDILLRGLGRFADDTNLSRQLHMRIVRAQVAHGRIIGIDCGAASALPGVFAVWTGHDVRHLPPIDFRDAAAEALKPYRQPVLAQEIVRYAGEPVAAVFACDPYTAEDAAALVSVETEELPVTMSAEAEPGRFAPELSTEAMILRDQYGEPDRAFSDAADVLTLELGIGRHSGVPLETRGAIARFDLSRDVLELYGAAKVPHRTRDNLARILGRKPESVHLKEGHTGGGFGIRGELYPEDVLVSAAALRFGVPVKWIEDRREHLVAANHSREQRHRIRAAVTSDGRVSAMEDEFYHAQGGYVRTHAARVAELTSSMLTVPYRIPAFRCAGHFRLTNQTPAATYRSPGRYEGAFVRERMMDAVAAKLGISRVEVRRRNLIAASEMPFDRGLQALGTRMVLDSGDYRANLDRALAQFGWEAAEHEVTQRRARGELAGLGLACFVEKTGLGPKDAIRVSLTGDGGIELVTGGASLGQGFETVMAQICADALNIDYRVITVIHGQTDRIADGIGAHASRATVMTGSAAYDGAMKLRVKLLDAAAGLLQSPADALEIRAGRICRGGEEGGPSISLAELAGQAGAITAEGVHVSEHMTYPYGVHLAQIRIDGDTGEIAIERYFVAYDIGRAVNPMMIAGQISGGFAQGLGGAMFEEFLYSPGGQPLSVTFADYLLPGACEVPNVEMLVTEDAPSPLNPLGLKGSGEAGVTAVGATLASAVDDALQMPLAIRELPIRPELLLSVINRK